MMRSGRISRAHSRASVPLAGWTTEYPFVSSTRPREWSRTTVIRTIVGALGAVTIASMPYCPQQPGLGHGDRLKRNGWLWTRLGDSATRWARLWRYTDVWCGRNTKASGPARAPARRGDWPAHRDRAGASYWCDDRRCAP